jgi:hypothetical protein
VPDLVAVFEGGQLVGGVSWLVGHPFQGARLRPAPAGVVAHEVECDRIQPGLLARLAPVEPVSRPHGALEGVREQVLGEGRVARPVGQEPEEWLGVLLVEPLEIIPAHQQ